MSAGVLAEPVPTASTRGRRPTWRRGITLALPFVALGALVAVLAGKRAVFAHALHSAPLWLLAAGVALQVVALLSRSEAWHRCVEAAGSTVPRRGVFRASGIGGLGSVVNGQIGVAARIATLRRSAPSQCPGVGALVAAEVPILAVEASLAALTSFTLSPQTLDNNPFRAWMVRGLMGCSFRSPLT